MDNNDNDTDSEDIKPAKKTKPMAQPSVTDFFEKKPAGSKAAGKAAASTKPKPTARKASGSGTKPPSKAAAAKKRMESSDDEILLGEPESALVAPRATAPRRAAAKAAYIELSDEDDD